MDVLSNESQEHGTPFGTLDSGMKRTGGQSNSFSRQSPHRTDSKYQYSGEINQGPGFAGQYSAGQK